jgi:hypothetical protein
MKRWKTVSALATAGLLAIPAAAQAAPSEALVKSVTVNSDSAAPVTVSGGLIPYATYELVVSGTYSPWNSTLWNNPPGSYWATCGTPGSAPTYPSPGVTNGAVGNDAAFIFAMPAPDFGCGGITLPQPGKFEINEGTGFAAFTPDGAPTAPTANHTYTYTLRTTQWLPPAQVEIVDSNYSDNYGELKVSLYLVL